MKHLSPLFAWVLLAGCGSTSHVTSTPAAATSPPADLAPIDWARLGLRAVDIESCGCSLAIPPSWAPTAESSPKKRRFKNSPSFERKLHHQSVTIYREHARDAAVVDKLYETQLLGPQGYTVEGVTSVRRAGVDMTLLTASKDNTAARWYFVARDGRVDAFNFFGDVSDTSGLALFDRVMDSYSPRPAAERGPALPTRCFQGTTLAGLEGEPTQESRELVQLTFVGPTELSLRAADSPVKRVLLDGVSATLRAANSADHFGRFSATSSGADWVVDAAGDRLDVSVTDGTYRSEVIVATPRGALKVTSTLTAVDAETCEAAFR